jgi:hypothetical protein
MMQPVFRVKDVGWWDVYEYRGAYVLVPQGEPYKHSNLYSWSIDNNPRNWINTVVRHPIAPKSEKQIQLEQAIRYHKQVIEHNERMIAKYEEELKNEG